MSELIDKHVITRPVSMWTDILLFKLTWVALVLFQDKGVIPALVLIALKLLCWPATPRMLAQTMLVLLAGITMDLSLSIAGLFNFGDTLLPAWLGVLWLAFALTIPRSFSLIGSLHPLIQAVFGMTAGLVGYFAGYLAGAVAFDYSPGLTAIVIVLCWGTFVPFQFLVFRKYIRF
jgi:hypothetical protein